MRTLTLLEIHYTSGGFEPGESNYDNFWNSFFITSGAGAGYLCSPFIAFGMTVYGLGYYGIVVPIRYTAYGISSVVNSVFSGMSKTVNIAMGNNV